MGQVDDWMGGWLDGWILDNSKFLLFNFDFLIFNCPISGNHNPS